MEQEKFKFEEEFTVTPTSKGLTYYKANADVSSELQVLIESSDVLLVPWSNIREGVEKSFPKHTLEFYQFLQDNLPENLNFEACIEDSDFREVYFHNKLLRVATVVVTYLAAPIVVNVISDYIKEMKSKDPEIKKVSCSMIVEKTQDENKQAFSFKYTGDSEEFCGKMLSKLKTLEQ